MADQIVGRESELGSVCAFLDGSVEAPVGLVLEGEPGVGKSTLWLAAVAAARERRGLSCSSSRPAEAERGLAHVGLGDLFDGVLDDVIGELSPPRRRALEVALLRDEAADEATDDRALAVAVRDVLNLLSERKPVVVAIDDVQWLDASSASTLAFALRRLGGGVRLVFARRLEPSELEQAVDVERLRVGPLSVGALHRLLHDRSAGRSRARRCCASMSARAEIRSSRWSSLACLTRTSTRSSRCRFRRRWRSSSARVSSAFLRPRATRLRSLRRWERRRSRSSRAPVLRRGRSPPQLRHMS